MQPRGVGRGWGGPCGCLPPPKSCVLEEGKDRRCERGAKWRCRRWHQAPRCDPLPMDTPRWCLWLRGGCGAAPPGWALPSSRSLLGCPCPAWQQEEPGGWRSGTLAGCTSCSGCWLHHDGKARPDTGTGSGGGLGAPGARGAPSPGLAEPPWCPSSSRRWDGALPAPPSRHPSLGDARWHWDRTGPWLLLRRASRGDPAAAPPTPLCTISTSGLGTDHSPVTGAWGGGGGGTPASRGWHGAGAGALAGWQRRCRAAPELGMPLAGAARGCGQSQAAEPTPPTPPHRAGGLWNRKMPFSVCFGFFFGKAKTARIAQRGLAGLPGDPPPPRMSVASS